MSKGVHVTAISLPGSDSSDAWSHRLTNGSYASAGAYDGAGEALIEITLHKRDVDAIKLADASSGVAPLATSVFDTFVGLDATFVRSKDGKTNVARRLGDSSIGGVPADAMTPDETAPSVTYLSLDMDAGSFVLTFDEPVRASEAVVTRIALSKSSAAILETSALTSSSTVVESGASRTVSIKLSDADLDELKRVDGLCANRTTSHVSFLDFTFLDRSAAENPAAAISGRRVDAFAKDLTTPKLEYYSLNMESKVISMRFDEPVVVASFNASCLTLQEDLARADGQSYRFTDDTYPAGVRGHRVPSTSRRRCALVFERTPPANATVVKIIDMSVARAGTR